MIQDAVYHTILKYFPLKVVDYIISYTTFYRLGLNSSARCRQRQSISKLRSWPLQDCLNCNKFWFKLIVSLHHLDDNARTWHCRMKPWIPQLEFKDANNYSYPWAVSSWMRCIECTEVEYKSRQLFLAVCWCLILYGSPVLKQTSNIKPEVE